MRTHTFTTSAPTWPLHAVIMDDDFSGDFEGYDEDESELDDFDCGLTDDGTCMNAGREWCDFECPMRDMLSLVPLALVPAHSRWNALSGDVGRG